MRLSKMIQAGVWDQYIPDPKYKPKVLTKLIITELRKAKLKGVSLVKDSEATQPKGGWEYGILIMLDLTPDDEKMHDHSKGKHVATIKINGAETRANGNVMLKSPDGKEWMLASKGGNDPVAVAKMLSAELVQHFLSMRND